MARRLQQKRQRVMPLLLLLLQGGGTAGLLLGKGCGRCCTQQRPGLGSGRSMHCVLARCVSAGEAEAPAVQVVLGGLQPA